jgi:hypothetical protein
VLVIRAGFFVALVPLDVRGFHPDRACGGHAVGMRGLDSGSCDRSSLFRPDRDGAVGAAILAGSFEGEAHMLTCVKLPVAGCFDVGEVNDTAARHLRRMDYAPSFVRVELLDHSRYSAWLEDSRVMG